jgi:hypothetical protein
LPLLTFCPFSGERDGTDGQLDPPNGTEQEHRRRLWDYTEAPDVVATRNGEAAGVKK